MASPEDTAGGPLDGIRVVDFSRVIAGPLAGQILADLGASVVKVESPYEADPCREYVAEGDPQGRSPWFSQLNRNKRGIILDLKTTSGIETAHEMIQSSDVLLENFRPGVMDRLGLGASALLQSNPRLIYCAISGFGDTGPMRDAAANDVILQGYGGVMSFTGPIGGEPVRCGAAIADMTAGLYAAIGVLAALQHRNRTGCGQQVRTSLFEGQIALAASALLEYRITGHVPVPMGSGTRVGLPNEAFPVRDGWILLAAVNERTWQRLGTALGLPELPSDPRFVTLGQRRRHRQELHETIASVTSQLSQAECIDVLRSNGIPCGPINKIDQVSEDPQLAALDMVMNTEARDTGSEVVRFPVRLSGYPMKAPRPAPGYGEHSLEVYEELRAARAN